MLPQRQSRRSPTDPSRFTLADFNLGQPLGGESFPPFFLCFEEGRRSGSIRPCGGPIFMDGADRSGGFGNAFPQSLSMQIRTGEFDARMYRPLRPEIQAGGSTAPKDPFLEDPDSGDDYPAESVGMAQDLAALNLAFLK